VPDTLPVLAVRNAVLVPGALVPLHLGRKPSLAAVDAALKETPSLLATFTQRDGSDENVLLESLHTVGCLVLLHRRLPGPGGLAFVIVRGLRWISLQALDPAGPYFVARVAPVYVDDADEAGELPQLLASLRARARRMASALPEPEKAVAMIDAIDDAERLANLVVVNLPCSVDDKMRYAAEPKLPEKLRIAVSLLDAMFGAPP